jgi:peptidase E
MNQIAIQHKYLWKQIYVNGGNMFRLIWVSHYQALHNFQTKIWRSAIADGIP